MYELSHILLSMAPQMASGICTSSSCLPIFLCSHFHIFVPGSLVGCANTLLLRMLFTKGIMHSSCTCYTPRALCTPAHVVHQGHYALLLRMLHTRGIMHSSCACYTPRALCTPPTHVTHQGHYALKPMT